MCLQCALLIDRIFYRRSGCRRRRLRPLIIDLRRLNAGDEEVIGERGGSVSRWRCRLRRGGAARFGRSHWFRFDREMQPSPKGADAQSCTAGRSRFGSGGGRTISMHTKPDGLAAFSDFRVKSSVTAVGRNNTPSHETWRSSRSALE